MSGVHPLALVENGAEIAEGCEIGPYCVVGPEVKLGPGCRLKSHVIIEGKTSIGSENIFEPFAVIGGTPQDVSYRDEPTEVIIGNNNVFREGVTVHRGTPKGRTKTVIGDHNYIMAYTHVAHDCVLGNHIILVNSVQLAGHVQVGDYAVIGGQSSVTQFCRIGAYCFVGGQSIMRKDLAPFMTAKDFSEVSGPNLVGLKRKNFSEQDIRVIRDLYKDFFLGTSTVAESLKLLDEKYGHTQPGRVFIDFFKDSKMGVQR